MVLINLEVNLLIGILEELTLQELGSLVQPICLLSCNQWEMGQIIATLNKAK